MQFLILQYVVDVIKKLQRGSLQTYADPQEPPDLNGPLTQDDINFVKIFKSEITKRFAEGTTCSTEKGNVSITDTTFYRFTVSWSNPIGYTGTAVRYRIAGDTQWMVPNGSSNARGNFLPNLDGFVFTSGFAVDAEYQILVQNACATNLLSQGIIVSAIATNIS